MSTTIEKPLIRPERLTVLVLVLAVLGGIAAGLGGVPGEVPGRRLRRDEAGAVPAGRRRPRGPRTARSSCTCRCDGRGEPGPEGGNDRVRGGVPAVLLEGLADEVWLVKRDGDALRHLSDVRRATLRMMAGFLDAVHAQWPDSAPVRLARDAFRAWADANDRLLDALVEHLEGNGGG